MLIRRKGAVICKDLLFALAATTAIAAAISESVDREYILAGPRAQTEVDPNAGPRRLFWPVRGVLIDLLL